MSLKSIPLSELSLLKKFMGMTTSPHDGEALTAMRKANAILAKYKLAWSDVLSRTVEIRQQVYHTDPGPAGSTPEEMSIPTQIRMAFDELRGVQMSPSFRSYIDSLEKDFIRKHYLSPDQRAPLFKAVRERRKQRNEA